MNSLTDNTILTKKEFANVANYFCGKGSTIVFYDSQHGLEVPFRNGALENIVPRLKGISNSSFENKLGKAFVSYFSARGIEVTYHTTTEKVSVDCTTPLRYHWLKFKEKVENLEAFHAICGRALAADTSG